MFSESLFRASSILTSCLIPAASLQNKIGVRDGKNGGDGKKGLGRREFVWCIENIIHLLRKIAFLAKRQQSLTKEYLRIGEQIRKAFPADIEILGGTLISLVKKQSVTQLFVPRNACVVLRIASKQHQ